MKRKMKKSDFTVNKKSNLSGLLYTKGDIAKQKRMEKTAIKVALKNAKVVAKVVKKEDSNISESNPVNPLASSAIKSASAKNNAKSLNPSKSAASNTTMSRVQRKSFFKSLSFKKFFDWFFYFDIRKIKNINFLKYSIYFAGAFCLAIIICTAIFVPKYFSYDTKEVVLNDNGFKVSINAKENTVSDLLANTGVTIGEHDIVEQDLNAELEPDMEIVIRRAMQINVVSGSDVETVFMMSGTVDEALKLSGVTVSSNDEIYPSKAEYTTPGMTITHIKITKEQFIESEKIGFRELTKNNAGLEKGKERVVSEGAEGVLESTFEVIYKNGVETSREKVASEVALEPVNRVIEIGTKVAPKPTPTKAASGLLQKSPKTAEIYSKTLYAHKNKQKPDASIIDRIMVARQVTAYTHTGKRTATGTWPRIGTIACYFKVLPKYSKIYVPGYGYGRVEDQGSGTSLEYLDLDLFMDTEADCRRWGRKRNYQIYVLK